jgi:hypothetical protein
MPPSLSVPAVADATVSPVSQKAVGNLARLLGMGFAAETMPAVDLQAREGASFQTREEEGSKVPWTAEEDEILTRFVQAREHETTIEWASLTLLNRSGKQCRWGFLRFPESPSPH